MRFGELVNDYRYYGARIKVKLNGSTSYIDTAVNAKNREMARRLFKVMYGPSSMVTNVREIK
jgi:hypothetical protein